MKRTYRKYISWLFAIALLVSCGMVRDKFGRLPGGYTNVTLTVPQSGEHGTMAWPNVSGGLMAYIVGINGTSFSTTVALDPAGTSTASATLSVPNGSYRVYGMAWAGPNKLESQVGCGSSAEYVFDGIAKDITLNIQGGSLTAGCTYTSGSAFATSGYNTINTMNFPALTVYACSGLNTSTCAAVSGAYNATGSVKVELKGYTRNGNAIDTSGLSGFSSSCYSCSGSGTYATSAVVPPGDSSGATPRFIATAVAFYPNTNTNCSGSPSKVVLFPDGVANTSPDASSVLTANGNLFVDVGP